MKSLWSLFKVLLNLNIGNSLWKPHSSLRKHLMKPLQFWSFCFNTEGVIASSWLSYTLHQVFPWQGFASRMLNTTLVGADIQNITPLCKGLWINICCICKDDRYCFGTSSFQRTLFHIGMGSLLKRQGSSRLLMQSKPTSVLAQVTEQNKIIPLSFLFAPSSTENTKLECQRSWLQHSNKLKKARTETLSCERVPGHCVGPCHTHAN